MLAVIRACTEGWLLALRLPSYVLLKWLVNLVIALCIVAPLAGLLAMDLDHSLFSAELLDGMDLHYPWELADRFGERLAVLQDGRLWFYALFVLVALYLNGGILTGLQTDTKLPWSRFFNRCGRFFPNMVIMAAVSLGMAWVACILVLVIARYTAVPALGETWLFWLWAVLIAFGIMVLTWVARFYDVWRLMVTYPDMPAQTTTNFARAFRFTARYHKSTFVVWAFYVAVHVGLVAFYLWLVPKLGFNGENGLWIELIAGQILIIMRIFVGLAHLGGMLTLLRENYGMPKPKPEKTIEPEPRSPDPEEAESSGRYPLEENGESPFFQEHV
ncbi:MAG: hypothetical protein QNK37_29795 [Acidobacteriota bacterium]|nr:hypothetical protein [Acidobacteriota bacterium]